MKIKNLTLVALSYLNFLSAPVGELISIADCMNPETPCKIVQLRPNPTDYLVSFMGIEALLSKTEPLPEMNSNSVLDEIITMRFLLKGLRLEAEEEVYVSDLANMPAVNTEIFKLLAAINDNHIRNDPDLEDTESFLNIGLFLMGTIDTIAPAVFDNLFHGMRTDGMNIEDLKIFCIKEINTGEVIGRGVKRRAKACMSQILREAGFGELLS